MLSKVILYILVPVCHASNHHSFGICFSVRLLHLGPSQFKGSSSHISTHNSIVPTGSMYDIFTYKINQILVNIPYMDPIGYTFINQLSCFASCALSMG